MTEQRAAGDGRTMTGVPLTMDLDWSAR